MIAVRITTECRGSREGSVVETFQAGHEYDLPEHLAAAFIKEGWAVDAAQPEPVNEKKPGKGR